MRFLSVSIVISITLNAYLSCYAKEVAVSDLEESVSSYLDSALKVAQTHQGDCKAQESALKTWRDDNQSSLRKIARLAKRLRSAKVDLSSEALGALQAGQGVMARAYARLDPAIGERCKLNKIGIMVTLRVAMMDPDERRAISKKMKSIKFPKQKPLPRLVTVTPFKPGPMGLFGPLEHGMSLTQAQKAQPALLASGGMWSSPTPAIGGVFWLRQGCAMHRKLSGVKGAFPWKWSDPSPSLNAYVECIGEVQSEKSRTYDDLDKVQLGDMIIDLFDAQDDHDAILSELSAQWGRPDQAKTKDAFGHDLSFHVWRDSAQDRCVILSAGRSVNRPAYRLVARKCWLTAHLLRVLLKKPKNKGAIIGSTLKELQEHYGHYSVWIGDRPNQADLKVPMYEVSLDGRGDTIRLTLDQGVVTRAEVSFSSKPVYTVDHENQALLTLSQALSKVLAGQLKPETIKAISAGPERRELKGGSVVNIWPDAPVITLESGLTLSLRAHAKMPELSVSKSTQESSVKTH